MPLADDIKFVGQLLDAYAARAYRRHVAQEDPEDAGVPPEMQVGDVDHEGYVEWQMMPSTVEVEEVADLEREFGIQFPLLFSAYLLARFHLFDQVKSNTSEQGIMLPATPSDKPLDAIRSELEAGKPLIGAGFIPFAQWGDGWGPMCFDSQQRAADGDCPIIWMDHELLARLDDEATLQRESIAPLAQPLYLSCREFWLDVFGPA